MTLFDDNFFPTPEAVIDRMVAPYKSEYEHTERYGSTIYRSLPFRQILEPSAGKGDIVDRLVKRYDVDKKRIFCVEQNVDLRRILLDKGYKVVGIDFLTYADRYVYDAVIMNPPFDNGAKHLLKAWETIENGIIICLLNAETLRNPYTEERQILSRLIDAFGEVEYIGQAFKDSERPTDVEVAIVRMEKQSQRGNGIPDFDTTRMDFDAKMDEPEFQANPLAHVNILNSIVAQYNKAVEITIQLHLLEKQWRFYTREVTASKYGLSKSSRDFAQSTEADEERRAPETLNEKLMDLKAEFWRYVFDKTKIGSVTTSEFQKKFQETTQEVAQLAFTEENILYVLELFLLNREDIIQNCIVNVFEKACSYHIKNQIHHEGWVSNKSYRLAERVILPDGVDYDTKWNSWNVPWSMLDFYGDFDKALCFLTGRSMDTERDPSFRSIYWAMENHIDCIRNRAPYDSEFESTFFRIRFFKKGTIHLMIKDRDLLARFNIAAAKGKREVGPGY